MAFYNEQGEPTIQILDHGVVVSNDPTSINFIGAGVSVSVIGGAITIDIPGGGGTETLAQVISNGNSTDDQQITSATGGSTFELYDAGTAINSTSITLNAPIVQIAGAGPNITGLSINDGTQSNNFTGNVNIESTDNSTYPFLIQGADNSIGSIFLTDQGVLLGGGAIGVVYQSETSDTQWSLGEKFGDLAANDFGLVVQDIILGVSHTIFSANFGTLAFTLNSGANAYSFPTTHGTTGQGLTYNSSGNLVNTTLAAGTVTSVSGTANRITSTGGATPVIDISSTFEALLGKVANPLSQFAATTSAQLAGIISDETGTGALVFANSPAFAGTPTAPTPTAGDNSTKIATTAFVQNALSSFDSKASVAYASTSALPANTYNNGTSGVGATLTGNSNGPLIIDGVTILIGQVGERVLVAGESAPANNGWYTITQQGVVALSPYILTRATDSDQATEIGPGYLTSVTAPNGFSPGSANNGKVFISIAPDPFVVGTSSLTFSAVGGVYMAGNGLQLSGQTFSIDTSITADLSSSQSFTNKNLTGAGNTFPTFNQNTTGSAAKWTTARNLAGNSVDGSANVAFANKFIVQGTADAGLSAAQFLGSLATGIVKNTTSTGILSIATGADLPVMTATVGGAVPTPPNNTTTFLRGDGTFATPTGAGTVTSVAATIANGLAVSGSPITLAGTLAFSLPSFNPSAGTISVAPILMTAGTNLTTATAGAHEYDGKVMYVTPASGERGVVPAIQFILLTSAFTTAGGTTSLQQLFNAPANGQVTLGANTTYKFRCRFMLTAMSSTSGSFSFGFGGTAALTNVRYISTAIKGATGTPGTAQIVVGNTPNAFIVSAANTITTGECTLEGTFSVGTGGTVIPSFATSIASASVVGVGSYFEITALGLDTVQSVGAWS